MNRWNYILVLGLFVVLSACGKKDKERLIGKWQCDQVWFEFFPNNTYNGGTSILTEIKGYSYSLDEKDHSLNLYTKEDNNTHYLSYTFKGNDTLILSNKLNSALHEITYIRKSTQP